MIVEVRRSGKKKPEPVELRFIKHVDNYDGGFCWRDVEQKASARWFKIETYEDLRAAKAADGKYRRAGDTVTWWEKEI